MLRQPPRDLAAPILTSADFKRIAFESAVLSAGAFGAYGYGLARYGMGAQANTLAFTSLTVGQLLHAFSCRSHTHSLFSAHPPAGESLSHICRRWLAGAPVPGLDHAWAQGSPGADTADASR